MNVLEIKDLCKTYPAFKLENVSFNIEQGKIMGFIGRNGAGKTTTLKSLMNFVHPDSGEIRFFGKPFEGNEAEVKQRTGFVTGGVDYYPHKKIKTISAVTAGFYDQWDEKAYERYLKMFELDENKTPDQLSAGMKVKYSLALALSHNAQLLILDEPTSGLDPVSREDLLDVFLTLQDEGKSILFSTHITSDLDKCADDITYIKEGKILESCGMKEFAAMYRTVEMKAEDVTDELKTKLIGVRRSKEGVSAIVKAADTDTLGIETKAADLESIMVHLEKEEQ